MSASDYFVGLLFLIATYGAVFATAEIIVRRRLPRLDGAARLVAWAILATAALLCVCLLPAVMTVLSRGSVLIAALLMVAIVAGLLPASADGGPDGEPPAAAPSSRPERLVAIAGVTAAALWLAYTLFRYRTHAPVGFDAASAYLPTAARWLQQGSIWEIADWVPNAFYGSGPGNGSVIVLSTMLPWDNDFLSHLAMYPYVVGFAVALYGLAREMRAPAAPAALLAVMVAAVPVVVQPGLVDGLLDPLMYAGLAAGLLFLVRHNRTASRADLALAGLALGICFGTKFYGYTSVAVVIAVWVGARLLGRVRPATVARQTLAVGALVLAAGGIWMLRDWIATGNPLMPLSVGSFDAPADPQRAIFGFTLLDYADQPSVWVDTLAHQFRVAAGLTPVVLVAALAGAAELLRRRRRDHAGDRLDRVAAAAIGATLLLALMYAATPYTAAGPEDEPLAAAVNVRYGIPAAITAVAVAAWLAGRLGTRWRVALAAAALLATVDALRIGPVTSATSVYVSFALGAIVAGGFALWGYRRPVRPRPPRAVALATAAVAAIVLAVAGQVLQRNFNDDRYLGADPALDYVIGHSDEGVGVGLAGFWSLQGVVPIYPSFGTRLENEVEFVGAHEQDALLRRLDKRRAFLLELDRLDPQLLVVGRDLPSPFDPDHDRAAPPQAELIWAGAVGYREVARSDRFIVLQRSPA
jgi:hypothetical protein